MAGYTKIFSSILMSSIWEESMETRLVWVTLLALADQHGHVDGTAKSLARVSRVTLEDCQKALDCLLGPDADDRSGVLSGRRLTLGDGGWDLVNYATYRKKMSADDRRERDRIRKRKARMSALCPQSSANVLEFQQAEAEAEAEAEANTKARTDVHALTRVDESFKTWWSAYPKKKSKADALKAWSKIKPSGELLATMLNALSWQRNQPDWLKDGGQFIPYPASYLNAGGYLDEPFHAPNLSEKSVRMLQTVTGGRHD